MRFSFENKRILLTGAAHGLGRELCFQLLKKKARIYALDKDSKGLESLRREAASNHLITHDIDLTNLADVGALRERIRSHFDGLDVLVNNAGIVRGGEFLKVSVEDHLKTIDVNLKSMIHMTHQFLPDLQAASDSMLLQVGSVTGMMGLAFGTSYSSSKWGVLGFSESLRQELRALKISKPHICVICPSYIATGMFEGAGAPRFMPFLKTSDLAKKIISAAESKKFFVKAPFMVKTVPLLRAALPLKAQDFLLDWFGVAKGMGQWRGPDRPL